jgi:ligand-binding sensor domain-containing protein
MGLGLAVRRVTICYLVLAFELVAEQLPYRLFTTADGLVRNSILKIRRDPNGYLWICTVEGISLFDGSHFTNYTSGDGLPNRHVNDLLPARDGTYWLATNDGLYQFWPRRAVHPGQNQNPSFKAVPLAAGAATGKVRGLLQDREGRIWAGSEKGLFRLEAGELRPIPLKPVAPSITCIYEDRRGRIWIGTANHGLYQLSDAGRVVRAVATKSTGGVTSIHVDSRGRLWIGGLGLACFDPQTEPMRLIKYFDQAFSPVIGVRAVALSETRDGDLWVAGLGLARLSLDASGRARLLTYETSEDLGREVVSTLELDSTGNLWVGLGHLGLARISPERFVRYTEADGLKSRNVAGIAESRRGGLLAISRDEYAWNLFRGAEFRAILPRLPRSGLGVMGWGVSRIVQQDREGGWWVASGYGVLHYSPTEAPERLADTPPAELLTKLSTLPTPIVVLQIFEDSRGAIWIGTLEGIGRRDPVTRRWRSWSPTDLEREPRGPVPAETFVEDHNGTIWAGLDNFGLVRFRGDGFERFTRNVPGRINELFVDSHGRIWIASNQALWRIDDPGPPNHIRILSISRLASAARTFTA